MSSIAERVDGYIDSISFGEGIDFDKYLKAEEKAKVKPADYWRQRVKEYRLNPREAQGLALPWEKAGDFRIRKGESTIHTGYSGHRKSMMLGLIKLAMIAQGEKCLSISLEMPPHITIDRMIKQYSGNGDPTMMMHDKFFQFTEGKFFLYDQIGTVKWKRVIAVSRYAIEELGVTQVYLDSLMKFGIKKKDLETQAEFVDEMTTLGKDTGAHFHLVAHANKPGERSEGAAPSMHDVSGSSDITNMVDNVVVHFQNKKEDRKYDQLLVVAKQRNPEGEEAEPSFVFSFDDESLQFKPFSNAPRMSDEEWERCQWR